MVEFTQKLISKHPNAAKLMAMQFLCLFAWSIWWKREWVHDAHGLIVSCTCVCISILVLLIVKLCWLIVSLFVQCLHCCKLFLLFCTPKESAHFNVSKEVWDFGMFWIAHSCSSFDGNATFCLTALKVQSSIMIDRIFWHSHLAKPWHQSICIVHDWICAKTALFLFAFPEKRSYNLASIFACSQMLCGLFCWFCCSNPRIVLKNGDAFCSHYKWSLQHVALLDSESFAFISNWNNGCACCW